MSTSLYAMSQAYHGNPVDDELCRVFDAVDIVTVPYSTASPYKGPTTPDYSPILGKPTPSEPVRLLGLGQSLIDESDTVGWSKPKPKRPEPAPPAVKGGRPTQKEAGKISIKKKSAGKPKQAPAPVKEPAPSKVADEKAASVPDTVKETATVVESAPKTSETSAVKGPAAVEPDFANSAKSEGIQKRIARGGFVPKEICKHYRVGKCTFGNKCTFKHEGPVTMGEDKGKTNPGDNKPGVSGGASASSKKSDTAGVANVVNERITSPVAISRPINSKTTWAQVCSSLPILLPIEPDKSQPLRKLAKSLNVTVEDDIHCTITANLKHEEDGLVVRGMARRSLLGAVYTTVYNVQHEKNQTWVDLFGATRNSAIIGVINRKMVDKDAKVTLVVHKNLNVSKDILRNTHGAEVINKLSGAKHGDVWEEGNPIQHITRGDVNAVIIEDVQHTGACDPDTIFELASKNIVVGIIFHACDGAMGPQGVGGMWIRNKGKLTAYPNVGENPYEDGLDMMWVLRSQSHIYKGSNISWFYEQIVPDVNVYYAIFTLCKPLQSQAIALSAPRVDYREIDWTHTMETRGIVDFVYNQFFVSRITKELVEVKIAHEACLKFNAKTLAGSALQHFKEDVSDRFNKTPYLVLLRYYYPDKYDELLVNTQVYGYTRALNMQLIASRGFRARALEGSEAVDNLRVVNTLTDRLLPAICCTCMAVSHCCERMPKGSFCHGMVGGCIIDFNRTYITPTQCSSVPPPEAYFKSVKEDYVMEDYLSAKAHWEEWGVLTVKRRSATQAAKPVKWREGLLPEHVTFMEGKKETPFSVQTFHSEYDVKSKGNETYAMGPSPIPFHFNAKSAGGMLGVVYNVIKAGPSSAHQADVWHGDWNKVFVRKDVVSALGRIDITKEERQKWCSESKKSKLYLSRLTLYEGGKTPKFDVNTVQSKTDDALLKNKERVIVASSPDVIVAVGPEIAELSERLHCEWNLEAGMNYPYVHDDIAIHCVWGSGLTAEEKGDFISKCEEMTANSYAGMYAGDDMAGCVHTQRQRLYVESDASDWDASQSEGAIRMEHRYASELGLSQDTIGNIYRGNLGTLYASNPERKAMSAALDEGICINLKDSPRRNSGEAGTSVFNTIGSAHMYGNIMYRYLKMINDTDQDVPLEEEADHLRAYIEAEGLRAGHKLKVMVYANPARITFLKGFFVPCMREKGSERLNGYCWFPSPAIFTKIGLAQVNPNTLLNYAKIPISQYPDARRHAFVADVLYGWAQYWEMPMLRALAKCCTPPGHVANPHGLIIAQYDRTDKTSLTFDHDWSGMLETLDVSEDEWDQFIRDLEHFKWQPGKFYVNDVWHKLSAVYR